MKRKRGAGAAALLTAAVCLGALARGSFAQGANLAEEIPQLAAILPAETMAEGPSAAFSDGAADGAAHPGVDFAAPAGAEICAAAGGVVVHAGYAAADDTGAVEGAGRGVYVEIDHGGGVTTVVANCSAVYCAAGDRVDAGQKIAEVGQTGWATGPMCHFELRVGGVPTDPQPHWAQ